jgi:hypothetical protein
VDHYKKEWPPIFSKERKFLEQDCPYGELERGCGAEGDNVRIFFRNHEDSVPCCQDEEFEDSCGGVRLSDVKSGDGMAGTKLSAWADDRCHDSDLCRMYRNPLTAKDLHQLLKMPV